MRHVLISAALTTTLACGGGATPTVASPPVAGACPDWLPLDDEAPVQPTGWILPIPAGVELVDRTTAALTQFTWEHPYDGGGVATFQFLFSELAPSRPLTDWTTAVVDQQDGLGRTTEATTVDLDGTTFTAVRYAQGFTHGIEIAVEQPDGGFRSATIDVQGSDDACAPRALETLNATLDGLRLGS